MFVPIFFGVPRRISHLWLLHRAKYWHVKIFQRLPFPLIEPIRSALRCVFEEVDLKLVPNLLKHVPYLSFVPSNTFIGHVYFRV